MHKRKNSLYLSRNELHSAFNRKNSAYFTFAGYLIKDKNSYLKGSEMGRVFEYLKVALILAKDLILMHYVEPYHK
ncbi:hypothetical protein [Bacillus sp. UNC41MFS5]|uniref:hypothetical protein n=1 Tax=Bacillus sp. UNC41MFS5 TaxID=1449046 RepID=UPI00047A00AE|nr:hypothetical protein [Bacillus sp. UNC41MFS5]